MSTWLSILIVLLLILLEGLFVAAELALVSLREGQVTSLAAKSRRGQKVAKLVEDPNRFLASVQLGVTLTALLSSAFGAVTLSDRASTALQEQGVAKGLAGAVGFLGVTLVITFVTLVVGELAPKRLALQRAESISLLFGPILDVIATLSRPVIWLLSRSTNGLVRLLGGDPKAGKVAISDEELRGLVAAHEGLGTEERRIVDDVFAASAHIVREVMVPRTEVTFLDATHSVSKAVEETADLPHSRYPVYRGSSDDVIGFVHIRDLAVPGRSRLPVGQLVRQVAFVPASLNVLTAMSQLRREGQHIAIVADEYGGVAGIITLEDLIEEILGDIRDEYDPAETAALRLRSGDLEVDGLLNLDAFREATGVELPRGPYETAAGFVIRALGHLPREGEQVEVGDVRLTVSTLDGKRVERLQVSRVAGAGPGARGDETESVAPQGPLPEPERAPAVHSSPAARVATEPEEVAEPEPELESRLDSQREPEPEPLAAAVGSPPAGAVRRG